MNFIKKIIKKIFPAWLINLISNKVISIIKKMTPNFIILKNWKKQGSPVPPPHYIKELAIKKYQKMFNIDIFVETGTYMGEMVSAMKNKFKKIYSIELSYNLWQIAVKKFKYQKHIKILLGDSGKILKNIIPEITDRAIFWLDGHYSAGATVKGEKNSPIFEELMAILSFDINHIILIDDARCFNGRDDYPTIKELSEFILLKKDKSKIEIKDDIIRVFIM